MKKDLMENFQEEFEQMKTGMKHCIETKLIGELKDGFGKEFCEKIESIVAAECTEEVTKRIVHNLK